MRKKELAIIAGPTAVGKSAVSVALAKSCGGEVISADSMQVYRHMDIGSAKIKPEEMEGVPHHLIDILDPADDFNVSIFADRADRAVKEIAARGSFPIICGGTGFYIQALLYGIDFADGETDPAIRKAIEEKTAGLETGALEERLEKYDPVSASLYHGNRKRLIRAMEYHELTGELLSEKNARERDREPVYEAGYYVLYMPREILYRRIEERVDLMMEEGLVDEVKNLIKLGIKRDMTSMQGLGYRQILDHLNGVYDLETAVSEIKKQTRHFAKRQMTWFRREKNVKWIDVTGFASPEETASYIAGEING
ncbi:MAG: tRNA (adenosine(37)-N6)-dimethylallyltransferase MiaA [Lachnospiraceae bacterium]|nr:tRNA (adenosine(37)-N6)-dimethylallyltransferase MiaA [Lachnospiraceae bacterium]